MDKKSFISAMEHLFESKLKTYTEKTLSVWYEELKKYPEDKVFEAIRNLIRSEDGFISVGKIVSQFTNNTQEMAEEDWQECLDSARSGGEKKISQRAARALNTLGGMQALRDSNRDETHWFKKNFLQAYNNVNYCNDDIRCIGQNAQIYKIDRDKMLEIEAL